MDLISRAVQKVRAASIENPSVPITSGSLLSLFGGQAGHAGKSVTEKSALGITAVWRAVNLISWTGAGLPLGAYKTDPNSDIRVRIGTGAAAQLLDEPHPDMTPVELWSLVYGSLCLYGNAYLLKATDGLSAVRELWWIAPNRIKAGRVPPRDERGRPHPDAGKKFYILDGNEQHPLYDDRILHIPGFGYDGVSGVSPIRMAREGLGLAMAAEEFGAKLFGSGSLATGILQSEQRIDATEAMRLKELWKAQGGWGLDGAHDIRVMGAGAKFQSLSIPPEDAQFLETRAFQIEEIARLFGVPPHMLQQTEKATSWGTGIESQNIGFVTYSLRPYLMLVEQRLTKMLRPQALYVRYTLEGLLRGDSESRSRFYREMWQMGVFSTNDIRRLEDLAPVDGGDTRYVPMNFAVLGQTPTLTELPALPAEPTEQEDPGA